MILKAPEGCGGMSWSGESFKITKKGLVKVPDAAVAELLQFGFIIAAPDDSEDPEALAAFVQTQAFAAEVEKAKAEKIALDAAQAAGEAEVLKVAQVAEFGTPDGAPPTSIVDSEPVPAVPAAQADVAPAGIPAQAPASEDTDAAAQAQTAARVLELEALGDLTTDAEKAELDALKAPKA